jgi:hypothetical protein
VPAPIGTPTPGYGYESGDPFDAFLPPACRIGIDASEDDLRAVVFVTGHTTKGTRHSTNGGSVKAGRRRRGSPPE